MHVLRPGTVEAFFVGRVDYTIRVSFECFRDGHSVPWRPNTIAHLGLEFDGQSMNQLLGVANHVVRGSAGAVPLEHRELSLVMSALLVGSVAASQLKNPLGAVA